MGVLARCEGLRNGLAVKQGEPGMTPSTLISSVTLVVRSSHQGHSLGAYKHNDGTCHQLFPEGEQESELIVY